MSSLPARGPCPPGCEGMLCAHAAAVDRQMDRQDQHHDAARRRHDGVPRGPNRSGRDAAGLGWGGAGARPLSGPSAGARGVSGSRRDRAAWRSGVAGPRNASAPAHQSRTPDAAKWPNSRRANRSAPFCPRMCPSRLRPAPAPRPWARVPRARTRPRAPASGRARPTGHGKSADSFPAAASSPPDATNNSSGSNTNSRVPSCCMWGETREPGGC